MALHAAVMMAILDQAIQTPVQIQCMQQVAPELWVKWLLPTIIQTIISLASITAGVLIAIWSFRASSRKEHRHWVLDQKKEEWRDLFRAFAELKKEFLPIYKDEQTAKEFVEKWDEMEPIIDFIAMMPFIFLAQELIDIGFYKDWLMFKNNVSKALPTILQLYKDYPGSVLYPSSQSNRIQSVSCELQSTYCGLKDEYDRIVEAMRRLSEEDLDIKAPTKRL